MCKIAAIIALGYHLFRSGRATDPRFEAWGAVIPPYVRVAARRAAALKLTADLGRRPRVAASQS